MTRSNALARYLTLAARILEEVGDDGGPLLWSSLSGLLPAVERSVDVGGRKLGLAFDLLGFALEREPWRLRPRAKATGPLDQAIRLRAAFDRRDFGPNEEFPREALGTLVSPYDGTSRALDSLVDALESTGFVWPIARTMFRGSLCVRLDDDQTVSLRLSSSAPRLNLAPSRRRRRLVGPVADDLLARHFRFERYTCKTQREVVHALLDADGPTDVIARLPTGWGKSLLYLLPIAEWKRCGEPHTAVVVAPITALQNDQVERITVAFRHIGLVARELNSTVSQPDRTATMRALRRGELDLLFLSPERLADPFFREILVEAAPHVRILVIDEAHMVDAWGEDFRPEFWRLGRARADLRLAQPRLRTLFLSATLTEAAERTLAHVFSLDGAVARFEEPHVRSELSIRVTKCRDKDERFAILDGLVRNVPKPCIVYFNRTQHVRDARASLERQGLRRLVDYMGPTAADGRLERLRAFHAGDVDVVLATNAFGLGVDKQDVRTVIHFDLPHSLDAYYQEIGRAGRDGGTAHAILLHTGGALAAVARDNLSKLKTETAAERALAMLGEREELPFDEPGSCLVPLHAFGEHLEGDSALNQMWNRVVLNLLERAGAIVVAGTVLRSLSLRRGPNVKALAQSKVLGAALPASTTTASSLDLLALSKRRKAPFAELSREVIRLVLCRALEWEPSEDDDSWMQVRRTSSATWSPGLTRRLEAMRKARLERAALEMHALRGFLTTRRCRMSSIAAVYGYATVDPCGHCDVCALEK